MLDFLGACAAGSPAAGPFTSIQPAAGAPVAQAADATAIAGVFESLVAAMSGTVAQPAAVVETNAPAAVEPDASATPVEIQAAPSLAMPVPPPIAMPVVAAAHAVRSPVKTIDLNASQAAAPKVDAKDDDDADSVAMPVAPMWLVLQQEHKPGQVVDEAAPAPTPLAAETPTDESGQRAAMVAANMAVAAKVAAAQTPQTKTLTASGDAPAHPDRHVVSNERVHPLQSAVEGKLAHAPQDGKQPDLGGGAPSDGEATSAKPSLRKIEFARALQAGIEIAAPAPRDIGAMNVTDNQDVPVPVRTALPTFAAPAAAGASRGRAVTPAVIGAPTPSTSLPLTVVPMPARDISTMAQRLGLPELSGVPASVEDVLPQIVQTMRVAFARGAGVAQIRLDPRQFGDLSVSLRVESGQVVARVQADAPAVREWLQTNQRALQDGLAGHQLRLARLEIVAPGDEVRDPTDAERRRQEQPTDEPQARRPKRRESTGTFEVVA